MRNVHVRPTYRAVLTEVQLPEFVVCDVTGEAEFPDEEILLEE